MTRVSRAARRALRLFPVLLLLVPSLLSAASWNGYSMRRYVWETPHFKIYYHQGIEHVVKRVGAKLEELYVIYKDTYHFNFPTKTEILLQDGDESNGLTFPNLNFIILWTHDFDFDMRGSHDWFDDVITHEFAHQASIWTALKYPAWMYGIRFGYFSHPNEQYQLDLMHELPPDILPPWFSEGIAQYESSRHGADRWDSHREMILRTLTLSHHLITWDHMQTFAGKGDDFEKTYNHGFSLVKYISEHYGYDKITAMARESSKFRYANFDAVIAKVMGKPARALYAEWRWWLQEKYTQQAAKIGALIIGKKINKYGYENYWPRFSPDGKKLYFLSNGRQDYGHKLLCSYALADTIKDDKKRKLEMDVNGFYDISTAGRIAYCSAKSDKSELPPDRGGFHTLDAFFDTLPPEKEPFRLFPKKSTEKQVTFQQGAFSAAFSPSGDRLVIAKRDYDRFFLAITDTAGKAFRIIYPNRDSSSRNIYFIYSVAWSPDGKTIAYSYFDKDFRRIGLYDTAAHASTQLLSLPCDMRDPCFSRDGKYLYFSSDQNGIFNIYRYAFAEQKCSRVTNVLGGAFAPAISPDGGKLAYAGYDSAGYGIYLLDSIKSLGDTVIQSPIVGRPLLPNIAHTDLLGAGHRPYSKTPRQFLLTPMVIAEALTTNDNNVYSGASAFKIGAAASLLDPYAWLGMGTELDAMFLFEPFKPIINFDDGLIDVRNSFDFGLYGTTNILPLTLSFDYSLTGIAGQDSYYDETNFQNDWVLYNIRLQNFDFIVSHYLEGQSYDNQRALHLLTGFNRYDVHIDDTASYTGSFTYNAGQEYRVGAMATFMEQARNSRSLISPQGIAAKLQYSFWQLYSLNENNSFGVDKNGMPIENENSFQYHEVVAHLKYGTAAPFFGDLHLDLRGDAIYVSHADTSAFPSFYLPLALVPGYTYYYQDMDTIKANGKATPTPNDTVLVTGKAVLSGGLSYRFPLSPPLIDKKIGIMYLEKLYGCLNASGGVGATKLPDLLNFNNWLFSYGAELRMQGTLFSDMPLAVSLRWDRGFDLPAPVGGNRFTLNIGFDFDYWGTVMLPDYRTPGITAMR